MTDPKISANCPRCGTPANPAVAGGLCPACLLRGVALGTDAGSFPSQPWSSPAIDVLAAAFPQLEILELIGRGGMGAVYKARQKSLGRLVALKILPPQHATNPSFAERFLREAQALAELNHPNIVTVHDFGRAGEFYYLLMEFVDGVNLRQAMKANRLTSEQALTIVPPICEALQFAHQHGIVHRDIKPENLLLDKGGRIKIADFGIARMLSMEPSGQDHPGGKQTSRDSDLTQHSILGTPVYMAPEQKDSPQTVDHRADIYSLGVVLYEMLTGELPAAKLEPPSRKVQIDVRLDEIVLRALETKPELRFATAADFRTQVEGVVNDPAASKPGGRADNLAPRHLNVINSLVVTPEQLATFEGQFLMFRNKSQLLLDDRQLTFARGGQTTNIPLASIRDLSIGHYPRVMNPVGLDFISVTYDAGKQTDRLFFSPYESMFGFPWRFNEVVADWFDTIRGAVTSATGRAPGNTPANQLGTPSGSPVLYAMFLLPVIFGGMTLCLISFTMPTAWTLVLCAIMIGILGCGGLALSVLSMGKRALSLGKLLTLVLTGLGLCAVVSGALFFARTIGFRAGIPQITPVQAAPPPVVTTPVIERPKPLPQKE